MNNKNKSIKREVIRVKSGVKGGQLALNHNEA